MVEKIGIGYFLNQSMHDLRIKKTPGLFQTYIKNYGFNCRRRQQQAFLIRFIRDSRSVTPGIADSRHGLCTDQIHSTGCDDFVTCRILRGTFKSALIGLESRDIMTAIAERLVPGVPASTQGRLLALPGNTAAAGNDCEITR